MGVNVPSPQHGTRVGQSLAVHGRVYADGRGMPLPGGTELALPPSRHVWGREPGSAGNSPTRRRQRKPRASHAGTGKSSCGETGGCSWDGAGWLASQCGSPPWHIPGREDGVLVHARADVLGDVGVGIAGGAQQRVVGLADSQEEGRVVAGGQLDNVRHQGRGTEPKHVDTWGWQEQDGRSPLSHTGHPGTTQPWGTHKHWDGSSAVWGLDEAVRSCYRTQGAPPAAGRAPARAAAQRTHKPYSPAQEGVEVAAAGINAALGTGASLQPGLQAVHDALPDHDLGKNRWLRGCRPRAIGGSGLSAVPPHGCRVLAGCPHWSPSAAGTRTPSPGPQPWLCLWAGSILTPHSPQQDEPWDALRQRAQRRPG